MSKKFLLSAIFAAGVVGGSAVAGDMQVLNEEELEEISAQGLQTVNNDTRDWGSAGNQENNLDSVQMNDNAQQNAQAMDLVAAATSSVNVAINVLWGSPQPEIGDPRDPEISTPSLDPVSAGTGLLSPVIVYTPDEYSSYDTSYDQDNIQTALNHDNHAGDGEVTTTVLDDTSGDYVTVTGYVESSDAEARNSDKETQLIHNNVYWGANSNLNPPSIAGQNNNNNSVQLNNNAQRNAKGPFIENSAQSASNSGINLFAAQVEEITGAQDNTQTARNMTNTAQAAAGNAYAYNGEEGTATQTVENTTPHAHNNDGTTPTDDSADYILITDQDNNNNSVQLNDNAQQNAVALTVNNNANTAKNTGINLHVSLGGSSTITVDQTNTQSADNHVNDAVASGIANAYNSNKETQLIDNQAGADDSYYDTNGDAIVHVSDQNNNNNSVQLNGGVVGDDVYGAQENAVGLEIRNSAISAYNTGLNVMAFEDSNEDLGTVTSTQTNDQIANNMSNNASGGTNASAYNGEMGGTTQSVSNRNNVSGQNNNNNSVQLNYGAQANAKGLTIANSANSAQNMGINILWSFDTGTISDSDIDQTNTQIARNHINTANGGSNITEAYNRSKETQVVKNHTEVSDDSGLVVNEISDQDNNNNSVQLNDNAQQNVRAFEVRNSALSASNTGINMVLFDKSSGTTIDQTNIQSAENMSNIADGEGDAHAYNGEMDANNNDIPTQYVSIDSNITNQNNNNNSVQLNDNAQQNAVALTIANNANSAHNFGINAAVDLINGGTTNGGTTNGGTTNGDTTTTDKGITNTSITQTNTQSAGNHNNTAEGVTEASAENINKQTQEIRNAENINVNERQAIVTDNNNNNNSVQLNDNAQQNAKGLEISNTAVSAVNMGFNIAILHSVSDSGANSDNPTIVQTNDQTARNFENSATAVSVSDSTDATTGATTYTVTPSGDATARNGELSENPGQYVRNVHARIGGEDAIPGQDNNNNSVQLNDNAQQNAVGFSIANVAKVALNSGFNVVWIEDSTNGAYITQENIQYAGNHNNYAVGSTALAMNETKQNQLIDNCYCADILDQNNNQNSVQVNDSAQQNIRGWHVVNGATSAVNVATNLMVTNGDASGAVLVQRNEQTAVNFSNTAIGIDATAGNLR